MPRRQAKKKQVRGKQPKAKQRGKHWTAEEEDYFWPVVMKVSPKAVGGDPTNTMSWNDCGKMMKEKFGTRYRTYTEACLYEHYFQNIQNGHLSSHAKDHVKKYKAQLEALGLAEEKKEEEDERASKMADPVEEERKEQAEVVNSCLGKRRNLHCDENLVIDPALLLPEPERPKKRIKIISRGTCIPMIRTHEDP